MLEAKQIRAARALLGWRQGDLARVSRIGMATIQRIENAPGPIMANVETLRRIEQALTEAGVVFLSADDHAGIGVRLKA